jgi:hypothetical protein
VAYADIQEDHEKDGMSCNRLDGPHHEMNNNNNNNNELCVA